MYEEKGHIHSALEYLDLKSVAETDWRKVLALV